MTTNAGTKARPSVQGTTNITSTPRRACDFREKHIRPGRVAPSRALRGLFRTSNLYLFHTSTFYYLRIKDHLPKFETRTKSGSPGHVYPTTYQRDPSRLPSKMPAQVPNIWREAAFSWSSHRCGPCGYEPLIQGFEARRNGLRILRRFAQDEASQASYLSH